MCIRDRILPEEPFDTIIRVENYNEPIIDEPKPAEPVTNNTAPVEEVPNNQNCPLYTSRCV